MKKIAAAAAAAVICLAACTSCGSKIKDNETKTTNAKNKKNISAVTELDSSSNTDSGTDKKKSKDKTEPAPISYNDTIYDAPDVPYIEYKKTYQAESGTITGDTAAVLQERAAFKGDGYISGATYDNWSLSFDLPVSQFYNISVQTASDRALNATLYVNGNAVWVFRTDGIGTFSEKQLVNIWLEEGLNEVRLESTENAVDLDYITIESNKEISMLNPDLSKSTLSNENASWRAEALYQVLCSNYGKQVLTAQHDTPGGLDETNAVKEVTGRYPAIRISDIGGYTKGNPKDITQAKKYWEQGGIIAYDWYWIDPAGSKSSVDYEIANVNFDIRKAVPETVDVISDDSSSDDSSLESSDTSSQSQMVRTERKLKYPIEEMAFWTESEIEIHHENKDISDECYRILTDIDTISSHLAKLADENIPVLWRPLPVASNGLFWWGLDRDSYKWLWQLMYTRMTDYHQLYNLVWVWSAQNAEWYVGDEYCDVLSADIYTEGRDAQINTMLFLSNISPKKPVAISECGKLPAMDSILKEKALWSYTALWIEPYLGKELGNDLDFDEDKLAAQAQFKEYYNNNYTLALDELPSIPDVAKSIRDKAKKDGRADTKLKRGDNSAADDSSSEADYYYYDEPTYYTDDETYYDDGAYYDNYTGDDYNYDDYTYDDYGYDTGWGGETW